MIYNFNNTSTSTTGNYISISGLEGDVAAFTIEQKKGTRGIHPELYFKYIKKKFSPLERIRMDSYLKKIEKAFDVASKAGQIDLSNKLLADLSVRTKEAAMLAKGIKFFIDKEDLDKYKHKIRGGHISDTKLKEFTRVIPKDVLLKKEKVNELFDDFIIYHYWNKEEAEKAEKKEKMSPEEKQKMKDPVLFGTIKECNRLYFIADWEDEYCDLTFTEMIDAIGYQEDEISVKSSAVRPF